MRETVTERRTGQKMARKLQPQQRAVLHVIDVDSGDVTTRLESDVLLFEAPNWSPDGHTLYVNGDGNLYRLGVDAGAGDLEQIDLGGLPEINNDHVLSPDGRTMYLSCQDGHIYAFDLACGGSRRVTNDRGPEFSHYLHGVSPDGQALAYIGLSTATGEVMTNVYAIPATGGADVQITDDGYPDDGAEFSPDGQWIYFNSERGSVSPGHAQLFRVAVAGLGAGAGGAPEQLTFDERVNWFPHPSPTGGRLVYVSFPPGTLGHPADVDVIVRLLESDGTSRDLMHLFGGQGTINVPSWSPDGRRIALVSYPIVGI